MPFTLALEAGQFLWFQGQPSLRREFQDSQGCLKQIKTQEYSGKLFESSYPHLKGKEDTARTDLRPTCRITVLISNVPIGLLQILFISQRAAGVTSDHQTFILILGYGRRWWEESKRELSASASKKWIWKSYHLKLKLATLPLLQGSFSLHSKGRARSETAVALEALPPHNHQLSTSAWFFISLNLLQQALVDLGTDWFQGIQVFFPQDDSLLHFHKNIKQALGRREQGTNGLSAQAWELGFCFLNSTSSKARAQSYFPQRSPSHPWAHTDPSKLTVIRKAILCFLA